MNNVKNNTFASPLADAFTGEQPDIVTLTEKEPIAQGPSTAQTPGVTSLLTSIYEIYQGSKSLIRAYTINDRETMADASIHIVSQFIFFGYSIVAISRYTGMAIAFFTRYTATAATAFVVNSIGLVACLVQSGFEINSARRIHQFRSKMDFAVFKELETANKLLKNGRKTPDFKSSIEDLVKNLKKDKIKKKLIDLMSEDKYQEALDSLELGLKEYRGKKNRTGQRRIGNIQKGLQILNQHGRAKFIDNKIEIFHQITDISVKQIQAMNLALGKDKTKDQKDKYLERYSEGNFMRLGRRIQPWLAAELKSHSINLGLAKRSPDIAIQNARYDALGRFLKQADEQTMKALRTHYIGLAAIALSALSFVAGFSTGGLAWIVTALLIVSSMGIGTGRYVYSAGYLNSRGDVFRKENLIPVYFRRKWRALNAYIESRQATDTVEPDLTI